MTTAQIIGWKVYGVAAVALVAGIIALANGHTGEGLKGVLGGFALIGLRDTMAKILRALDNNRKAIANLRAAIDTHWSRNTRG